MIAKGNRHNDGAKLARYMMTGSHEKGERAELYQLRGFGEADNILDAFRDVEIMRKATKADNALFHVQVRLPDYERLTDAQWEQTADRIEKRLGLTGQARAIYFHVTEQTGERHMHVAWSLIDARTMTAKPLPFFKLRLKQTARQVEKEFGLTEVKNEREDGIKFAPTKAEQEQARRLGVDIHEIRNTIRQCWDDSENGRSFQEALEHEGLILAQGDRRGLVVIDYTGGIHALGKRILDVNKAAMLDRLADLDVKQLPTVEQARALYEQDRESQLTNELAVVENQIEAARPELVQELSNRYINNLEAYHDEMPELASSNPELAWEVEKRVTAALEAEINAAFREIDYAELFNARPAQQEKTAPPWDRKRDDRHGRMLSLMQRLNTKRPRGNSWSRSGKEKHGAGAGNRNRRASRRKQSGTSRPSLARRKPRSAWPGP